MALLLMLWDLRRFLLSMRVEKRSEAKEAEEGKETAKALPNRSDVQRSSIFADDCKAGARLLDSSGSTVRMLEDSTFTGD